MKKVKAKPAKVKKIPYLDYMSNIGERVYWHDIRGKKVEGILVKMDDDFLATVRLDDGTLVNYQC